MMNPLMRLVGRSGPWPGRLLCDRGYSGKHRSMEAVTRSLHFKRAFYFFLTSV